ncbi:MULTISPECIES: oligosaccharide flippase family protein [Fusobacterium]|nr:MULTISPECIES: oligosaccharide flippase family protein [Fusobacterium]EGN63882.1 hypothetical protein HMPREF0404_01582 [Fusobacterium animalis 21_1A]ERT37142.1 hypothetical protein HMPREF1540_00677 [Fusobacterium nucleatum CTI-3]MCL4576819.1 hypothetical protein [Fusobacterium nucleatum YWH7056]MCL4583220.1 hypothetical protein [Fusobacterium nucleatum YWH7054]
MKIDQIKIGAGLSIINVVLGALIQFFYTPVFLKYLGISDYGINSFIQSLMRYMSMLNLGFGTTMLRYIVRTQVKNEDEKTNIFNGIFLVIFLFLALVCFILGLIIYFKLPLFLKETFSNREIIKTQKVFLLLLVNVTISFPMILFSTFITSKEKYIFLKFLSFINIVLNPLISIILIKNGFGIFAIANLTLIFTILIAAVNIFYSIKLGIKIKINNYDRNILKELVVFSFYIFLGTVIDRLYWDTDRIIIGKYLGASVIGIYSISNMIIQLYMSVSTAVSEVLLTKINQMVAKESNKEISNLFIKIGRLQYMLIGLICTGFIIFGKDFIHFWIGEKYSNEIYNMTIIIMLPLTVPLIQNVGITILQAKNKHKFRAQVYFIIAIMNVIFSIVLVKKYGPIGCAIGTSISLFIGNIIIINIYYHKKIKLDIVRFWKEIIKITYVIVFLPVLWSIVNIFIKFKVSIGIFILQIICYTLIYLFLIFYFAMNKMEREEVFFYLKKKKGENNG